MCASMRHMEVNKVCQTESVVLFWQKSSLSLHPGSDCMSVSVILVCPFFLPISACWIWGKRGRRAVKARCLCPPFLLMINVWLFSEEKNAWELELSKWITFKFYPSLNPAGMIIVCGDSHIIFVLPTFSYTWGSLHLQLTKVRRHLSASL